MQRSLSSFLTRPTTPASAGGASSLRSTNALTVSVPAFLLLGLLLSVAGMALEDGDLIGLDQPIANGTTTAAWPSVAALLDTGFGAHSCSGTVIGPKTILTAAHCVCDGESAQDCDQDSGLVPGPDDLAVFIPNAGFFAVQSVHYSPDYGEGESDIAIVKLKEAVLGVAPMSINDTRAPAAGAQGTISGFGLSVRRGRLRHRQRCRCGRYKRRWLSRSVRDESHVLQHG